MKILGVLSEELQNDFNEFLEKGGRDRYNRFMKKVSQEFGLEDGAIFRVDKENYDVFLKEVDENTVTTIRRISTFFIMKGFFSHKEFLALDSWLQKNLYKISASSATLQ